MGAPVHCEQTVREQRRDAREGRRDGRNASARVCSCVRLHWYTILEQTVRERGRARRTEGRADVSGRHGRESAGAGARGNVRGIGVKVRVNRQGVRRISKSHEKSAEKSASCWLRKRVLIEWDWEVTGSGSGRGHPSWRRSRESSGARWSP